MGLRQYQQSGQSMYNQYTGLQYNLPGGQPAGSDHHHDDFDDEDDHDEHNDDDDRGESQG